MMKELLFSGGVKSTSRKKEAAIPSRVITMNMREIRKGVTLHHSR